MLQEIGLLEIYKVYENVCFIYYNLNWTSPRANQG